MEEIWKKVSEFPELYEVSNLGKVRSVDRIIIGKDGISYPKKGKILTELVEDFIGLMNKL